MDGPDEASFSKEEIRTLIRNYIRCKSYSSKSIDASYRRKARNAISNLQDCTCKVEEVNNDLSELIDKCLLCQKSEGVDIKELTKLVIKELKLLQILIAKKNCPISAIVDKL